MEYQTPVGYLAPSNVPRYNGLTDPKAHVLSFERAMNFYGGGDRMKSRAFRVTLMPNILQWYSSLPRNSVDSWEDLKRFFLNRYTASAIQPRFEHALASITQKEDESLKDYLARFDQESGSVPDLKSGVAVLLFIQGLLPGSFRDSFIGKPPQDMAELRQRSTKYINLEEFNRGLRFRESRAKGDPQQQNRNRRDERGRRPRDDKKEDKQEFTPKG